MGKVTGGIFGPVRGKVGGVVFSRALGGDTVRAYSVPSNPRTAQQQANRGVFGKLGRIGSDALGTIVQPLWDGRRTGMSGYNAFVQENKNRMGDTFDHTVLTISTGDQPTPIHNSSEPTEYGMGLESVIYRPDPNWQASKPAGGLIYILIIDTELGRGIGAGVMDADDVSGEVALTQEPTPADTYLYAAYLDTSKAEVVLSRDASNTFGVQPA